MLFAKDDNLYFQDGDNSPVKLAEKISNPYSFNRISDDNQKVIFHRDDGNIYSIDTDGTREQILIPNGWLDSLEAGTEMDDLNFIPDTHFLFFKAVLCKEQSSVSLCSTSIFLADADTAEIRKLADLGLARQKSSLARNIEVSPNGEMIAVGAMDGMKIFTLDGKSIRQNVLPYTPSMSDVLFPSLFWLPDSSGLIVALPTDLYPDQFYADGFAPAYAIWRYTIDGNLTIQIPFDPPVSGYFQVSPDGNRIVYGGISLAATELYLGNLTDRSSKKFGDDLMSNFHWSSDSQHFIHGNAVVTSFDRPPVYGGVSPEWIDPNHYIYLVLPSNNSTTQLERVLIAEIRGDEVYYYESGFLHLRSVLIKSKP
jgi:Tol biopolymer transport system component